MIDDEKCQPITTKNTFFADPDPKQSVYGCLRIVKNSNSTGRHKNEFSRHSNKQNNFINYETELRLKSLQLSIVEVSGAS
jgi:hypothetical protein